MPNARPDDPLMSIAPLVALESPWSHEFDSARIELRRLFSEFLGTFLLVLVGAGGAVVDAASGGQIGRGAGVSAPGLMVMAMILFMGAVSGAHLNPAVTLAFALRGDFPWRRVPGYILVQLVAAVTACLLLRVLFGNIGGLGSTLPGAGFTDLQAVVVELLLTVGLVSTILGTASTAQNVGPMSALAVGGYIVLAGLWSSPVSGASMNPARSFGPALVTGDFGSYWVYVAGPILGAAVAVGLAVLLRGRGGDAGGRAAARGELGTPALVSEAVPAPREGTSGAGTRGTSRGVRAQPPHGPDETRS
jgi:aquaporin Z